MSTGGDPQAPGSAASGSPTLESARAYFFSLGLPLFVDEARSCTISPAHLVYAVLRPLGPGRVRLVRRTTDGEGGIVTYETLSFAQISPGSNSGEEGDSGGSSPVLLASEGRDHAPSPASPGGDSWDIVGRPREEWMVSVRPDDGDDKGRPAGRSSHVSAARGALVRVISDREGTARNVPRDTCTAIFEGL
eukprot:CAMPEP_0194342238 /NCGR_PEP_ID=MMETSP0171-20130528/92191_1 /TAXON_ID=218684 /ORGANISM="Corethron pennatum, Strain L29A3" /LENGTH=190 /DNA_ID=CAMNT_0039107879 /DNA_START=68 /DNA_END=636 /DNA_ORIENTATION=+